MTRQKGFDGEKGSARSYPITEIPVFAGSAGEWDDSMPTLFMLRF